MEMTKQSERQFSGVRLQIENYLSFDEVLERLRSRTGRATVPQINELASKSNSIEEFAHAVNELFVGSSGFIVFAEIEHSTWIKLYGIERKVLRIILGNPLIAITMMEHDVSAGLFAPVEQLLVEDSDRSALHYVRPSTLIAPDGHTDLYTATLKLDQKLES